MKLNNVTAFTALSAIKSLIKDEPAMLQDDENNRVLLGPVRKESSTQTAKITNHAVLDKQNITDHSQADPKRFMFSTFLVDDNDLAGKLVGAAISALKSAITGKKEDKEKIVEEKIEQLELWKENGTPLKYTGPKISGIIETNYDISLDNMVIASLNYKRDESTGVGFDVSLTLQRVKIAEIAFIDIKLPQPIRRSRKKGKTQKKSETGNLQSVGFKAFLGG